MGLTKTYGDSTTPVVAIIGAGFSGLNAAIRLKTQLDITTFQIFEVEADVGGTWWNNTYPGAGSDSKSHNYAFSFEPKYDWKHTYLDQPEILEYMKGVAQKHNLYEKILFRSKVVRMEWVEERQKWLVDYQNQNTGTMSRFEADIVIAGMGPLNFPQIPDKFKAFEGPMWHTARWDHSHDLTNKRVAIVGGGASAVQVIPAIVDKVQSLEVYQRSPSHIVYRWNRPYSGLWHFLFRYVPFLHLLYYYYVYLTADMTIGAYSVRFIDFIPRLIMIVGAWLLRFLQVRDPILRAKVTPKDDIGCRRILISNDYYPALARKHVTFHSEEIASVKGRSLIMRDGSSKEVDYLVLATGFDVHHPFGHGFITGKNGKDLVDAWIEWGGPLTYYGVCTPVAPNLFFLLGSNTALGHSSVLLIIESQVEFAIKAISHMMKNDYYSFTPTEEASRAFVEENQRKLKGMVWYNSCKSWYKNEHGLITTLWWSTCARYAWRLRKVHPKRFIGAPRKTSEKQRQNGAAAEESEDPKKANLVRRKGTD